MAQKEADNQTVSRDRLAELLNEDLSREYQAIIAYVVYSQVLKGAEFMSIADQLEVHAGEELEDTTLNSLAANRLSRQDADRNSQSPSRPRRTQGRCFGSISTMKMKRSETTGSGFVDAKPPGRPPPWLSRFVRSWSRSRSSDRSRNGTWRRSP